MEEIRCDICGEKIKLGEDIIEMEFGSIVKPWKLRPANPCLWIYIHQSCWMNMKKADLIRTVV